MGGRGWGGIDRAYRLFRHTLGLQHREVSLELERGKDSWRFGAAKAERMIPSRRDTSCSLTYYLLHLALARRMTHLPFNESATLLFISTLLCTQGCLTSTLAKASLAKACLCTDQCRKQRASYLRNTSHATKFHLNCKRTVALIYFSFCNIWL